MEFNEVLRGAREHIAAQQPLQVPDGWGQGRATFGGMAAALLYEAVEEELSRTVEGSIPLRSLTLSFVAPAEVGELNTSVTTLRAGRSAVQIEARATQGNQVVTAALASFGRPRESTIVVRPAAAPAFPAPQDCEALPYIEGIVPEFTRHFDYRIAAGGLPFSGNSEACLGGWIRFKSPTGPTAISHLLALIDAWPPAVLPMLKQPAPASSMAWTVEILQSAQEQSEANGEDWWQYLAEVDQAGDGYAVTQARLWDAQGNLVALSRQTVSVFG
ncbi:acyl-CoA thioesterase [Microbulbifer aggregans]|uniref:acyl-CoA thioesterase n=1 Tax=Microbulbifer aggregans TaxID=1769779 RepID=UPI001CFD951C|nr:thioesterase family protein [Microbulbifer aggregans]